MGPEPIIINEVMGTLYINYLANGVILVITPRSGVISPYL